MKMNVSSQNAYECSTTCLKPKKKKKNGMKKELILATYKNKRKKVAAVQANERKNERECEGEH